jgi:prepilin-type N-terminal cleavage/methylation domain-containing protein
MKKQGSPGFTLIELLIFIGIIGILAAIILVAVDPAKRLKQARNARRFAETNAILNAILNYTVDYKGTLPTALTATSSNVTLLIGSASSGQNNNTLCPNHITGAGTATGFVNLQADAALVDAYISEIPVDPRGTNGTDTYSATVTGYYIKRSTNGRVEVGSCNPESEDNVTTPTIKIKR